MVTIFVKDLGTYVCTYTYVMCLHVKKNKRGIIGVASHGKYTRVTEHTLSEIIGEQIFTPVKFDILTMTMLPQKMMLHIHYLARGLYTYITGSLPSLIYFN